MRPYRGRQSFEVRDPILEPLWSGTRVICHLSPGLPGETPRVRLIEALGADVAPELPALAAAIGTGFLATDAILDGVVSRQVVLTGVGASPITEMRHRPALILRSKTELDVVPRGPGAEQPEEGDEGFIAVDLLRVDGTTLLDVPLLERKRLLESVIEPGPLLRVSTHVRPPIDSWVATWKSLGLRGGILKAANSRYVPGGDGIEWRIVEHLGGRR
jgi:ATP-dependent DNA ligase